MTIYVYKQFIEMMGNTGWHLSLSENPPDECTLPNAECLGSLEPMAVPFNRPTDEVTE